MDLADEDVVDEDMTNDAADAGVASSDTSSSEAVGNEETDHQSRSAVFRILKDSVASLFANARRANSFVLSSRTTAPATTAAAESLRIRQYSDSAPDDAQQLRDDEDHAGQRSVAEADEQNRAAVAQSIKADVASLSA